jgi:hypothetical protein
MLSPWAWLMKQISHFPSHRFNDRRQRNLRHLRNFGEMNTVEEQKIAAVRAELWRIQNAIDSAANDWERQIGAARSVINLVDSTSLMQQADRADNQIFIISRLQRFAYHDVDSGGVRDIAEWCVTQWLGILQRDPESVEALSGSISKGIRGMLRKGLIKD